MIKKIYKIKRV